MIDDKDNTFGYETTISTDGYQSPPAGEGQFDSSAGDVSEYDVPFGPIANASSSDNNEEGASNVVATVSGTHQQVDEDEQQYFDVEWLYEETV